MRDAELYQDYDLDSDIEEEEIKQGAPSQPPPYCNQSYSPGAAPAESDFSDATSDSSALSSDDDNPDWTESAVARPPGFRSTDTLTAEPLSRPFSPTQRMVLVRSTAFATWACYIYYCYTGQVSFYPLRSKDPLSRRNNTTQTLRCSPKSMYRLALKVSVLSCVLHGNRLTRIPKLKNARLEALAFQAIKSSLRESNILAEAFSWFTAQYTDIQNMELDLLMEFRSSLEVSSRLERMIEAVSRGEKRYARTMLHAFLARLTRQGTGSTGTQ
ncbi:uncharacterized protein BJ212DRAFT_1461600 [Suillus subaureus]|uniref:Uncharacterized protein n=1 Tax=Suillus subaureus TaxID=48587 RepID=A0A9P7EBG5_9AGAM|nr:uncharacterized protein BJ212DRAFT_1461600 [Suillus subaureus]KAG1816465.1 hypothetical protein BJ212DRAFT_1461600 [Suillus subaureus]